MTLILKTCLKYRIDDLTLKKKATNYNKLPDTKLPKGLHRTFQNSLLFNKYYNVGTVSKNVIYSASLR